MKYRIVFFCFGLLILLACSGRNLPKGVLSHKRMVPILVDIHLSEAINAQKFNISMNRDSLPEDLYLSICRKYKIERSVLDQSLFYYGKHTSEYIPIYNEVLNVLSEMEVKAKSDTIRHVRIGGFDLDTTKTKKAPSPGVKSNAQIN